MTDAVAKSSSLANYELVNECHLIGGIDNVGRVEQIYVEAKETFWEKKKKRSKTLPLPCWDSEFSLL